jgi:hypothetical protein
VKLAKKKKKGKKFLHALYKARGETVYAIIKDDWE